MTTQAVFSQPGALPAATLEQVIGGIRGLDMDTVRAKVAESQDASAALFATTTHRSHDG